MQPFAVVKLDLHFPFCLPLFEGLRLRQDLSHLQLPLHIDYWMCLSMRLLELTRNPLVLAMLRVVHSIVFCHLFFCFCGWWTLRHGGPMSISQCWSFTRQRGHSSNHNNLQQAAYDQPLHTCVDTWRLKCAKAHSHCWRCVFVQAKLLRAIG